MKTIYLDFDNTIVESNAQIISLINKKYGTSKCEKDLLDYGYASIYPITEKEKLDMYESDEFFNNLNLKPGVLDVINKYLNKYEIIVTSKGTPINLSKKEEWIKNNLPSQLGFIGIVNDNFSKKSVNMENSIQIDDNSDCLDTNAELKILYKNFNNFPWQKCRANDNFVVSNTWEEIDEILDFYNRYDYKTLKKES